MWNTLWGDRSLFATIVEAVNLRLFLLLLYYVSYRQIIKIVDEFGVELSMEIHVVRSPEPKNGLNLCILLSLGGLDRFC